MVEQEDKRLPLRSTRGKRLTKLLEDEDEADVQFWNQEAFKEDDVDDGYQTEEEEKDEYDSDFFKSESEDDEEGEEDDERRQRKRKRPPGAKPAAKKPSHPHKKGKTTPTGGDIDDYSRSPRHQKSFEALLAEREEEGRTREEKKDNEKGGKKRGRPASGNTGRVSPRSSLEGKLLPPGERRSSRTAVVVRAAEREIERTEAQAKAAKVVRKKKPVVEERRLTQQEMLEEAAQTEMLNLAALEVMLAREEEIKRRAIVQKEVHSGPQIRFHSKNGLNTLEFISMSELPAVIKSKAPPYPKPAVCAITGLPAKYRDPATGLPYATLEAFKKIRKKWAGVPRTSNGAGPEVLPMKRKAKLEAASFVAKATSLLSGGKGRRERLGSEDRVASRRFDRQSEESDGEPSGQDHDRVVIPVARTKGLRRGSSKQRQLSLALATTVETPTSQEKPLVVASQKEIKTAAAEVPADGPPELGNGLPKDEVRGDPTVGELLQTAEGDAEFLSVMDDLDVELGPGVSLSLDTDCLTPSLLASGPPTTTSLNAAYTDAFAFTPQSLQPTPNQQGSSGQALISPMQLLLTPQGQPETDPPDEEHPDGALLNNSYLPPYDGGLVTRTSQTVPLEFPSGIQPKSV